MKRKRKQPRSASSIEINTLSNPFDGLDEKECKRLYESIGIDAHKMFDENFAKLESLLEENDSIYLLCNVAYFGQMGAVTVDGKVQPVLQEQAIDQSHVELVQALTHYSLNKENVEKFVQPETMQEFVDRLRNIFVEFSFSKYGELATKSSEEEKTAKAIQEWIRTHTAQVRNFGYFHRVKRLCECLYEDVESVFESELGTTPQEMIAVFSYLVNEMEKRFNDRFQRIRKFFGPNTVDSVLKEFHAQFPEFVTDEDKEFSYYRKHYDSAEAVKHTLFLYLTDRLTELFTFRLEEISEETGIKEKRVDAVLTEFSIQDSDFRGKHGIDFFLSNPVWEKPIIPIGESTLLCFVPYRFFHNPLQSIESKLTHQKNRERISKRRAIFLEDEIIRLFDQAFDGARLNKNVEYQIENVKYETDALVQVDSCLFIVEAKSTAISLPALRGAIPRMKREVSRRIIEPSEQSQRLERLLITALSNDENVSGYFKEDVDVDWLEVKRVVRLSVTLDDFGILHSNIAVLKRAGWVPTELAIAPTIILSDLEIVFDILQNDYLKIHYLMRRGQLQEEANLIGSELDLLGFYLDGCFNLPPEILNAGFANVAGHSDRFNSYYQLEEKGIKGKKPVVALSKRWKRILDYISKRKVSGWTEIAYGLLNLGLAHQDKLEGYLPTIRKKVRRNFQDPEHENSIIMIPEIGDTGIVWMTLVPETYHKRKEFVNNIAAKVFEGGAVSKCVIVCECLGMGDSPYDMIALLTSDLKSTPESF